MSRPKKKLSKEKEAKQKRKGTYDSPCLSDCTYKKLKNDEKLCLVCGLIKSEKKRWPKTPEDVKDRIWGEVQFRLSEQRPRS